MNYRFLFVLFFFVSTSFAQIGMNEWRIHFSAFNSKGIAEASGDIYYACGNGIVNYDMTDNSVNLLTVTNGLSDLGISSIDSDGSTVMVGYVNGNLDVIEGNTITNVSWIKIAELSGDKTVHAFAFDGDLVYVATGIGLVVFDNAKKEIKDTYYPYTNPTIFDVAVHQDTLFLGTTDGIYYAHKDKAFLNDKNQWAKRTGMPFGLASAEIKHVESFGDKLLFAYDDIAFNSDSLYSLEGAVITPYSGNPLSLVGIKAYSDELLLSQSGSVNFLDTSLSQTGIIYNYPNIGAPSPTACVKNSGSYWVSDQKGGLMQVPVTNTFAAVSLFDDSPATDGSYRIDIQYGKVLVASGGLTTNLLNTFFEGGVCLFDNESWTNFNYTTQDSIVQGTDFDFVSVAINQNNTQEMAFSGFSKGGLKIVRNGVDVTEVYTDSNSPIEAGSGGKMVITDMKYDDDGNLWIVNQGLEPLKCFTPSGAQYSFSLGSNAKNKIPYRLMIDQNNVKWIALVNTGLIAFDDGGTLDDPSDDQLQTLSTAEGSGNLPSYMVKAVSQDIDGEIWIGTEEGMVVLYSTANLFDGDYGEYDATAILLEVNGEVEKLLGESFISAIAVDGGNRKWIGTSSSGVFCLSPDGLTEVYRFTSDNSPLVSNTILDIKVDHASGEVYFATDKGLVSFRSDATIGDFEFSSVKVFPNPVEPGFNGSVTIQGLGYQSDVKITDVSG
ncbi:hypothetical protein JYT21_00485, partial [bacterium AH-315-B15]|nr:hypothetical protein [bacterium AH-315-B15]